METRQGPWIQTYDGDALYLLAPQAAHIRISTLAIVLSRICRFGGHTRQFYSVAEHSLRVCEYVRDRSPHCDLQLAALLHDAHEAYSGFGDVCRPARELAPNIEYVQARLDRVIAAKYGFAVDLLRAPLIRLADATLLATEGRDLMLEQPQPWVDLPAPLAAKIVPLPPHEACWQFDCAARRLVQEVRNRDTQEN